MSHVKIVFLSALLMGLHAFAMESTAENGKKKPSSRSNSSESLSSDQDTHKKNTKEEKPKSKRGSMPYDESSDSHIIKSIAALLIPHYNQRI